jgi:hypothetical protein
MAVVAVGAALTAGLALTVTPIADDHLEDARVYIAMAEHPLAPHPAPYCYRVLVPLLARILPLELSESFHLLTVLFVVATGVLVYYVLRQMGMDRLLSFAGLISFYGLNWAARFAFFDFRLTDAALFFFASLCLFMILKGRIGWAICALSLGTLAKESMLFMIPFAYGIRARRVVDLRALGLTAMMGAVPIVVHLVVRSLAGADYHPDRLWSTIGRTRLESGMFDFVRAGTVGTWGVGLLLLGLASGAAGGRWLLRAAPFLVLVYLQPFFATNVDRLLVFGFLAVIPLAVMGWTQVRERFNPPPWAIIGYAAIAYLLLLVKGRTNFNSPSPEQELLALAAWTVVVLIVTRRNRTTRATGRTL